MVISDFSVRRPIVAIVASILLVVFGLYAIFEMPVRESPNIDRPNVSITVFYQGAAAEVIESKVVKIIEDQISGISGIKTISSMSRDNFGNINLEFVETRRIEDATNDIRDQVSKVVNRLPEDAQPPVISKADSDSDPMMFITLSSPTRSALDLTDYALLTIQPRLTSLDGVALINTQGDRKKAMRVWLDRRAMAARGLTEADIEAALRRENIELGAGQIESKDRNFTMRTIRAYQTAEDFGNMVVGRGANNYLIKLAEVATVELGPVDVYSISRANGEYGIRLEVVKQPGASTLDVAKKLRAEVDAIRKILPPDIKFEITQDTSTYIKVALREVTIAMVVAAALVMIVIYLFLGTIRAAFIPAVTVPISLVAAAIVMWPAGFSINILTLLAMVLAIGLVVDDAIIMLENIHRRMHEGEPPLLAAVRGAKQVGAAVVATSTVLAATFIPIALLKGSAGALFKEFAVAMAVAVLFSMFVSLTLTPVMCSKILTPSLDDSKLSRLATRLFDRFKAAYSRRLNQALDRPWFVVGVFGAVLVAAGLMFGLIPQEFTPREDRGFFNIQVRGPEGATTDYADRQMRATAALLAPYRASGVVTNVLEGGGRGGGGGITVMMPDWSDPKHRSAMDIARELGPKLQTITGAQVAASFPAGLGRQGGGGGGGGSINVSIAGQDYDQLRKWRDIMMDGLAGNPMFNQVRNNFVETTPQVLIRIDRNRAGDLGVSINTIGQTLAAMLGSRKVTTFVEKGKQYDVILQGQIDDRRTPTDVSNIYVRSDTTKQLIPLSSVVTMEESSYVNGLSRLNRQRNIMLFMFPRPDVLLGDVINEVQRVAAELLPPEALLVWRGEAGDFKDNSTAIYFSFALALVVVFLVLAAQFESFLHPLVIMMTVPLAVTGALAGLLLFGQSMNLYSQIGIIVLVGLAAKNGILIVEFTNQLRDAGREFREAVVEAALTRFRPIVMTALATVMGAMPLVLAHGAGAESRRPIGVVIAMGVSFATLITLFVVP
ncbi:MAG: efflux RND transporter permease subunit, partial [Rhodospirillaceae bacterium]